jgi:long-chain acyl-CoA synthetase
LSVEIRRIFDILHQSATNFPDFVALNSKKRGEWVSYSYRQYQQIADELSIGLIKTLGVQNGDHIASITNNRPEWNFLDMAIAQVGAVHVPLYPNYNISDFKFIINNAEVKYIFTGNKLLWELLSRMRNELPLVKEIFCFDEHPDIPGFKSIIVSSPGLQDLTILNARKASVSEDDLVSIYYTSGTTGYPKGATVTHKSLTSDILALQEVYNIKKGQKVLSYLPLCHSYESAHNYIYQYRVASVYYAESTGTVIDNMKEVQPEMFLTVPLLLEKIVDLITEKGRISTGLKKQLHNWAYRLALRYEINQQLSISYQIQLVLAKLLVYRNWKSMMGGKVKLISAGGASASGQYLRLFAAMGITVLEIYGLTETYCITVNSLKYGRMFGTAGVLLKNVQVKINEDGEILAKSPYITKGYYKQPELTSMIFDSEGWFYTGDIGSFVNNKFLKIEGRKSVTFKTSSGNFVMPENIENLLKQNVFIKHILLVGKDKGYLSALIVPNFENIIKWCKLAGIEDVDPEKIITNNLILNEFQKEIDKYNRSTWETEMIKKFKLLNEDWTITSGELTPIMKIKRNFIEQKYRNIIEEFYKDL